MAYPTLRIFTRFKSELHLQSSMFLSRYHVTVLMDDRRVAGPNGVTVSPTDFGQLVKARASRGSHLRHSTRCYCPGEVFPFGFVRFQGTNHLTSSPTTGPDF